MRRLLGALAALLIAALGPAGAVAQAIPSLPAGVAVLAGPQCPTPGVALVDDFVNGIYCQSGQRAGSFIALRGASFSRIGQELAPTLVPAWIPFGSGVPAVTNAGLSVWESRTNKNTNYNAAPTDLTGVSILTQPGNGLAALSLVSDAAAISASAELSALRAAGVLNGNAILLDNTLGNGQAIYTLTGTVGNVNSHTFSVYARSTAPGSMTIRSGSVTAATFTPTATWARYSGAATPSGTGNQARFYVEAGNSVLILLNQMEEGAPASPPIVVAGSSATRSLPTAAVAPIAFTWPFTVVADATLTASAAASNILVQIDNNTATHRVMLYRNGGGTLVAELRTGVTTTLTGAGTTGAASAAGRYRIALSYDGVTLRGAAMGVAFSSAAAGPPATLTHFRPGITSAGSSPLNGSMRLARVYPWAMSDAELAALSALSAP